jgi:hypothetical protein
MIDMITRLAEWGIGAVILLLIVATFWPSAVRHLQIAALLVLYFAAYLFGLIVVTPLAAIAAAVMAFGVMGWQWSQRCTKALAEAVRHLFPAKNSRWSGIMPPNARQRPNFFGSTTRP